MFLMTKAARITTFKFMPSNHQVVIMIFVIEIYDVERITQEYQGRTQFTPKVPFHFFLAIL